MDRDGSNPKAIPSGISGAGSMSWRTPGKIYCVKDRKSIWVVDVNTGDKAEVHRSLRRDLWSLSVSSDCKRAVFIAGRFAVYMVKLDTNPTQEKGAGSGCGAGISPDGTILSNLISGHRYIYIREWWTTRVRERLDITKIHPRAGWDDPRWAVNSNEHIMYSLEKSGDIVILNINTGEATKILSGNGRRDHWACDFFLGVPAHRQTSRQQ